MLLPLLQQSGLGHFLSRLNDQFQGLPLFVHEFDRPGSHFQTDHEVDGSQNKDLLQLQVAEFSGIGHKMKGDGAAAEGCGQEQQPVAKGFAIF